LILICDDFHCPQFLKVSLTHIAYRVCSAKYQNVFQVQLQVVLIKIHKCNF